MELFLALWADGADGMNAGTRERDGACYRLGTANSPGNLPIRR